MTTTIDDALAEARARLDRLDPREAAVARRAGALLVDIRPEANRVIEGEIPGAVVIDRNVLEWRLDPASDARIAEASYDAWVVLFCNAGYASSLAAATLQDLGIHRATDVVGGFRAWRAAGLPVLSASPIPLSAERPIDATHQSRPTCGGRDKHRTGGSANPTEADGSTRPTILASHATYEAKKVGLDARG